MKTINKQIEDWELRILSSDPVEIRAVKYNESSTVRLIEWRIVPSKVPSPNIKIKGIWPFRRRVVYEFPNPWRKIEIIGADGEDAYMAIGNSEVSNNPTRDSEDMDRFILWRNKLKTVEDVREWTDTISACNKQTWCKNHGVTEFIKVDTLTDEFGSDEIWK